MDNSNAKFNSAEEYLSSFSPEIREKLEALRSQIKRFAPEATERISYGMPSFYLNGNLVYFAALKNHIGFYPTPSGIEAFSEELKEYKFSKGAVQFPLSEPLPMDMIGRMVEYRVRENLNKTKK